MRDDDMRARVSMCCVGHDVDAQATAPELYVVSSIVFRNKFNEGFLKTRACDIFVCVLFRG